MTGIGTAEVTDSWYFTVFIVLIRTAISYLQKQLESDSISSRHTVHHHLLHLACCRTSFFSERTTLRSLYAIGRPSVVCLSMMLVHPTQAVELFGNFFHHTIAQGLYFSGAKNHWWWTPLSP